MHRHNHNPFSHHYHNQQQQEQYNSITLCGPTRSKCGYCQGSRTDILSIPNPPSQFTVGTFVSSHNTGCTVINDTDLGGTIDTDISSTNNTNRSSNNANSSTITNPNNEKITPSTSSKAYSILSSTISPNDYQKLLNKGWRRSGDLLYLPKNWECCCPSHPIRLDVNKFKLTKSLKKVMKNLKIALGSHLGGCEDSGGNKSTSIAAGALAVAVGSSNCSSNSSDYTIETDMSYEYNATNATSATTTAKQEEQNSTTQSTESLLLQGRKRPRKSNHEHTTFTTSHHHHHNNNLHNTNTPKIKDEQPPNIDQIHKHTKEYIHTKCHHILSWLQTMTMQIVQDNANTNIMDMNNTNDEEDNNHHIYTIMKKCSNYKITKMSKPKHLHSLSSSNNVSLSPSASVTWEYDMIITLSSTICTALHGISKGQIDKEQLGNVIVQELLLQRNTECNSRNNMTTSSDSNNAITTSVIDSISIHPKSGHVNVTIKMNITMMTHNERTVQSKIDGNENNTKKEKKIENVLPDFIQTYLESTSTNNTTTNVQSSQTQKVQPQPPFKLTVKSIPSCISGRDPKVHRLYTKYQAAIHHDPDPYSCNNFKGVVIDRNHSTDNDEDGDDSQSIMDFDGMNTWMSGMESEKLNIMDFRRLYKRCYDEGHLKVIYKR